MSDYLKSPAVGLSGLSGLTASWELICRTYLLYVYPFHGFYFSKHNSWVLPSSRSVSSSSALNDIPLWFILWSHHSLEREILRVASVQCQPARSGRRPFSRRQADCNESYLDTLIYSRGAFGFQQAQWNCVSIGDTPYYATSPGSEASWARPHAFVATWIALWDIGQPLRRYTFSSCHSTWWRQWYNGPSSQDTWNASHARYAGLRYSRQLARPSPNPQERCKCGRSASVVVSFAFGSV